ncbi:unnamed protein product [Rhizoctonia solani]|uniref:Uncharacterized protein n=1 Tax=Rhizoctonia solani TaxID=456999 RepID=A0A8H3DIG5_9AGAM|nr:unnamed protein product [Rhizoctonia solani]CAE6527224.1 unnamed protein product [Rhizoctonia solani]
MIIDPIARELKSRTITEASPTASTSSPQITRSVDQCFYTGLGESSSSPTSDNLIPSTQGFANGQNHSEEEPSEPPPAYEDVVVASTPNTTRRVLKRSAHRSSCASSQQSGDSRGHIVSEPWETIHPSMRPVPETSDSLTFEKLPRPFVIQAKTSKHKLPDLFSSVGTPALARHDVRESDWDHLLQELVVCSRYSTGQRFVASVLPVTKCLGPPGCLANFAIEQGMRKSKLTKSLALLETWNEGFFKPRKLEVVLCKGDRCKSGRRTGFLAPDRTNIVPRQGQGLAPEPADKDYRLVVISI